MKAADPCGASRFVSRTMPLDSYSREKRDLAMVICAPTMQRATNAGTPVGKMKLRVDLGKRSSCVRPLAADPYRALSNGVPGPRPRAARDGRVASYGPSVLLPRCGAPLFGI
jgi:hypothetical protein